MCFVDSNLLWFLFSRVVRDAGPTDRLVGAIYGPYRVQAYNAGVPQMVVSRDRHTWWYQGIQRIYRNAVVKYVKTVLQENYPQDWESIIRQPFGNEWATIVENADLPRRIGAINSPIQDPADYLGVNHFYNLFEAHYDLLFPTQDSTATQIRKQEKSTVLNWVKEIKIVRDPESHPPTRDMDFDDLIRQLDTARRICAKFDSQAAGELAAIKNELYSEGPTDFGPDVEEQSHRPPLQASLPPRESISPQFIGREDELAKLRDWLLDPNSRVWLLAGDGGKGKTAIAYQFATLIQQQSPKPFEFIIWLSAKQRHFVERKISNISDPDFSDLESALNYILTEYGLPEELSKDIDEKKRAVLEYMEELPALIILDDINSLEGDIVNSLSFFMSEAVKTRSKFLFTSRLIPFGMDTLTTQISGFPPQSDDGRRFVGSRVRLFGLDTTAFDTQTIDEVLTVTDGSPLYIEDLLRLALLGDNLRQVCAEWKDRKGAAARKYALGREFDRITPDARVVLLAAALYNAPVSTSEIAVAAGREFDGDRVRIALGELQNLFLVPKPRIVEDIPRFTLNQNTRELVLEVTRSTNPDRFERVSAAVKAASGRRPRRDRQDRIVVGSYIRQAVSLVKLEKFGEAEETIKRGLEDLPETPDLYGQLGWVYRRWMPSARVIDARACFKRAAALNCTSREMYYHWCQLEKEDGGWTRMAEAATTGLKVLKDNLDLEYFAGYAHSRQAHDLLTYDQLERAEDEAELAQHHLRKVLIDPEDLEPGQYRLHSMAYEAMALTVRTIARIATARGDENGTERNLRRLASTLKSWKAEHPDDPSYDKVKTASLWFHPRLHNLLNTP